MLEAFIHSILESFVVDVDTLDYLFLLFGIVVELRKVFDHCGLDCLFCFDECAE